MRFRDHFTRRTEVRWAAMQQARRQDSNLPGMTARQGRRPPPGAGAGVGGQFEGNCPPTLYRDRQAGER
jgi:hypothetical protein